MIEAWIDGACEPVNPGGTASFGVLVKQNGVKIYSVAKIAGSGERMSNNVGEYSALIAFFEWYVSTKQTDEITIYSDSEMLVHQMCGDWRARKGLYLPFYDRACNVAYRNIKADYKWIPRERNTEADKLSKDILRAHHIIIADDEEIA